MSGNFVPVTWINGSTPVDAANMQRYDDWIQQFEGDSGAVTLNGGTSGTATLYETTQGTIKRVYLVLANFRTAGAAQPITLPAAFTSGGQITTGEIGTSGINGGIQLLQGASAQTIRVMTSLSATGSTYSNETIMYQGLVGDCKTAFDTIQFPASASQAINGFVQIIGV